MGQFQRDDPISGQSMRVLLHDPFSADNRLDDYQVVSLWFEDDRQYLTAFWRDPQKRGRHSIEEPGMVLVHDLTTELILAAVDNILAEGLVEEAFERIVA